MTRSTASRREIDAFLAAARGGRFVDRRDRRDHVLDPPRHRSPLLARRSPPSDDRRASAPTSSVPTSTSTGTRPSTRSRRSPAASRGTRTTATRSSSRSSTSRAGWRSPTRPSTTAARRSSPGVHRHGTLAPHATSTRSAGSACTEPPRCRRRRGARGRRGRVLVAHPAPHRPEHDRRGAQGLHPPVRPDRRRGAARRPEQAARNARTLQRTRAPVPGVGGRPAGLQGDSVTGAPQDPVAP